MIRWLLAATIIPLAVGNFAPAAEPQSVQSFVALTEKWPEFAQAGLRFHLEGRYRFLSRKMIRFENCDLPFEAAPGQTLPRLPGSTRTAEVTGHLAMKVGKPTFIVQDLRERPSDLDAVRARRVEIVRRGDAEAWYGLGRWIAERASFYGDDELQREADAANLQALTIERSTLAADDVEGRFALAEKAAGLKLESARVELLHEAFRLRWDALRKKPAPDYQSLLDELARDLPGSARSLAELAPALEKKYRELPLAVYGAADATERRRLHRLFFSEVALAMIRADARPDGRNGFEIAARIEKLLPERKALAEQYRDAELQWRLSRVASLSRSDMLDLARQFEERDQPAKALETKRAWLIARTERLRQEGASGLVVAAEEYINLLDDRSTAVELLIEAHRQAPESQQATSHLRQLGYVWNQGRWLPSAEAEALPLSPIQQAIREGRIARGMTAAEVRQALGAPASVARVATAEQINEVWIYGERNASRLAIHFLRPRQENAAEARVVGVSQVRP